MGRRNGLRADGAPFGVLAVLSLVLGVISVVSFFVYYPVALGAAIGAVAVGCFSLIKQLPGEKAATVGTALGGMVIILLALFWIFGQAILLAVTVLM